jgi:hypothetical protein
VRERQQRKGGAWIMELGLLVVIVRTLATRGVKFSDGCRFGMNSPFLRRRGRRPYPVQLNVLLFSVSFL